MILIPGRIHQVLCSGPKLVKCESNQLTNLPCHSMFKDTKQMKCSIFSSNIEERSRPEEMFVFLE